MLRPIRKIHITSDFEKGLGKLPVNLRKLVAKRDQWFRANAMDSRLRAHPLKGELNGYWSYSVNYHLRILFRFIQKDEVIYYDLGTHEIYR